MTLSIESLEDFTDECAECDRNRYVTYPAGDVAEAEPCASCFDPCPACDGDSYIYVTDDRGYERVRECPVCGTLHARIKAYNAADIPARYHGRDSTLERFQTHIDDGQRRGNLPDIKMKVFRWVKGFAPGDEGLLLHGEVGTGKTHLLAAIVRRLTLEKGIRSRFVEFSHLLSNIREQFDQGKGESAILDPLGEIPVLAVDELGKGRNTAWQLEILDNIVSRRYNRGLTTLFTTNYELDDEPGSGSGVSDGADLKRHGHQKTLREKIGERIYSRLHEMIEFIHIDAPDYRKQ
jgi:DNA replication protein DnaC